MNTNSVKKFYIDDVSFSEIDFDLYDKFKLDTDLEGDEYPQLENDGKSTNAEDCYPVEIDSLIEKLNELKIKGANYVQIDYHCDHIGYDISGWLIRKVTQEDIDLENSNLKEFAEKNKQKQIKDLEEKLSKLKGE